jgi:dethiobiotin synthetase
VPLNERETYADMPGALQMPVVLVVPLKLGCINHALLTAEAIRRDGLTIAGWVANRPVQEVMTCEQETLEYLMNHLAAPCMGVLPWQEKADPKALSKGLNVNCLFEN